MARKKQASTVRVYKSYRFINKDPAIDKVRTAVQDFARTSSLKERAAWKEVELRGGPVAGTLGNWFLGGVKRPQFASLNATLRAIGKEFAVVDVGKKQE